MIFYNENNEIIKHNIYEKTEQNLVNKYINEDDIVLELGARYGTVSCLINSKLNNKQNQVSVEPDPKVISSLIKNRELNKCNFHIISGFISEKKLNLERTEHICQSNIDLIGYGATFIEDECSSIPSYSLDNIEKMYNFKFNTLVIDCEGFFEEFLNENKDILNHIKKIIIEEDYKEKCNYSNINKKLIDNKFKNCEYIIEKNNPKVSHRVWIKD